MSVPYYGDFPTGHTGVIIPFNAFTSDDPSESATITEFVAGDVKIYKNGSDTERNTANGVTVDVDFDTVTGGHIITIDLSNNDDASFYVAGSEIGVRIEGTVVDGATLNPFVATFSIERAGGALALIKALHDFDPTSDDVAMVTALHADYDAAKVKFANGKVYVSTGGASNTTYPTGEAPSPTDTLARVKSIADTNNIDAIDVHGDHTMSEDMEGYAFCGHGHLRIAERINIDSHSVEHSSFRDLVVQGTMVNTLGVLNVTRFDDCKLWALSDIHGISTNGVLLGACSILDLGIGIFNDPGCGALAACTLTLNAPAVCFISNMRGVLTLATMTGGTAYISMAHGSTLTILVSCSSGTITVSGDTSGLTDQSAVGCTVNIVKPVANTVQVSGTTQAANDNSTDINAILALLDDARSEPGQGAPTVNPDAMTKLDYLYKAFRNKSTQNKDTGVMELYNDAGAVVDQKATNSDDGTTFEKGKIGSGA